MAKKQIKHNGKPARVPRYTRRMECAGCDKFTACTDKGGSWLCEACAPHKGELARGQ